MGNCLNPTESYAASLPRNESIDMAPLRDQNLPVIIIYGGPGTGKATQSKLVARKYGLVQISCSNLLREEVSKESQRGVVIAKIMTEGNLVPASLVLDLIKQRMLSTCMTAKGYVIDGFPREKVQAVQFDEEVVPVNLVIHLFMEEGLQRDRCQGRTVTSGRNDDTSETIEQRIKHFRDKSSAILKYYKEKLVELDGARGIESIFKYVCYEVDEVLGNSSENKE